ncbi:MAG: cell wall hydrolase [Halanaerobiales bacterium]|nr:cell wall hydrolase [Halanaerobiales bacterium]
MTSLEILTRIIWAEAESEIMTGKVAVGASVINQAKEEGLTILQVIQAPGQFESYANNRFWQAPYRSKAPMLQESKQSATRALQGEDPIWKKTHFCAHKKNPCRWHYSQTPPLQYVGNHVFIRAKIYG